MAVLVLIGVAGCASPYEPRVELWPAVNGAAGSGEAGRDPGSDDAGDPRAGRGGSGGDVTGGSAGDPGGSSGDSGGHTSIEDAGRGEPIADTGTSVSFDAHDAGGAETGSRVDGSTTASHGTCLSLSVTTTTHNGQYSPRNVGAIWIAGPSGTFVKTLAEWGVKRISRLAAWNAATTQAGLSRNTVDAVTGATLSSHQTHQVSWNCADTKGKTVPDGSYTLHLEMDDDNSPGPTATVSFSKGPAPFTLTPSDQPNFKKLTLVYTP